MTRIFFVIARNDNGPDAFVMEGQNGIRWTNNLFQANMFSETKIAEMWLKHEINSFTNKLKLTHENTIVKKITVTVE